MIILTQGIQEEEEEEDDTWRIVRDVSVRDTWRGRSRERGFVTVSSTYLETINMRIEWLDSCGTVWRLQ